MRTAKKEVRSALRRLAAFKRNNFYHRLMSNPGSREFHQLVNYQLSKASQDTNVIISEDLHITDPYEQAEALATHYKKLGTPHNLPNYDDQFLKEVERDNTFILEKFMESDDIPYITADEVKSSIQQLHKGKATDADNLAAEHLIYAIDEITPQLTVLFRHFQKQKYVPVALKSGIITSIPKKGKDPRLPGSHRGITVSSVIGKVFEGILRERHNAALLENQDDMQCGFTKGLSPLMAALIVTEAESEARRIKRPLFTGTLDATKAFDTVVHAILIHHLHTEGNDINLIGMANQLYDGLQSQVSWKGYTSKPFKIKQGV